MVPSTPPFLSPTKREFNNSSYTFSFSNYSNWYSWFFLGRLWELLVGMPLGRGFKVCQSCLQSGLFLIQITYNIFIAYHCIYYQCDFNRCLYLFEGWSTIRSCSFDRWILEKCGMLYLLQLLFVKSSFLCTLNTTNSITCYLTRLWS